MTKRGFISCEPFRCWPKKETPVSWPGFHRLRLPGYRSGLHPCIARYLSPR